MNYSKKERLHYIDIAKGIVIICIILGHLGISKINRIVFTFHVPVFFFITGFFTNKKRTLADFIKTKFRNLIVPYIVTCLVMIMIGTLEGFLRGEASKSFIKWSYASLYGAGDSYSKPFYIPAIGAIWFLWASFWGGIFLRISLEFNKYVRISFLAALFIFGYYSRGLCWFPLSIQAGACAAFFMYIGWLIKDISKIISRLSSEQKCFGILFAVVIWVSFIIDFKSFWLVHCDVGRGAIDIFGCICASMIIVLISRFIDGKMLRIGDFLGYFGRHSLLMLCVHIVELNLFPWWEITGLLIQKGMPGLFQLPLIIILKIAVDLSCVYVISKNSFVRFLFGYS